MWFWSHRDQIDYPLNRLYRAVQIRKQSMHQWLDRQLLLQDEWEQLLAVVKDIRIEHPGMSARKLYHMVRPSTMGRDRFISLCMEYGLRIQAPSNPARTTNSLGVTRFPNLIKGIEIKKVNQVWVSDITYYRIGSRFYYLTFIMDLKSRFIVGHCVSKTLSTNDTTIPALKMAIGLQKVPKGLILHSDGGGQYYSKEYLDMTKKNFMKNSMTQDTGENNHAERINGTIKNQYLSGYMPTTFEGLVIQTQRAVDNYNFTRPHESLNLSTPSTEHGLVRKKNKHAIKSSLRQTTQMEYTKNS